MQNNNIITLNLSIPVFAIKILEKSGYLPLKKKSIESFTVYALLYANSSNVVIEKGRLKKSSLVSEVVNLEIKIPPYTTINYHPDRLRIIQLHLVSIAKKMLFTAIKNEISKGEKIIHAIRTAISYYKITEDEYPEDSIKWSYQYSIEE